MANGIRSAIRRGRCELVKLATLPGRTERFDLEPDPGETTHLAAAHPDRAGELQEHQLVLPRQMNPAVLPSPRAVKSLPLALPVLVAAADAEAEAMASRRLEDIARLGWS